MTEQHEGEEHPVLVSYIGYDQLQMDRKGRLSGANRTAGCETDKTVQRMD